MRRTRHVILPVRSWQYIGFLVVSLACLTFGLVSRDREGHAGSLAGPELSHLAPHDVDACPNLNELTNVPSCGDSRYDQNFVLRKSWPTESPGHTRASPRQLPRASRTQESDRRSGSRLQEGRDSRNTQRVAVLLKNTRDRAVATGRFAETRYGVKEVENRRLVDPTTRRARSVDESRNGRSRSNERSSRITGFVEAKGLARVEVNTRRRVANRQSEILGTRDRRQRFLESRRVNGPLESRGVRRIVEERSLDHGRSRMSVLERRSPSVENLQAGRDVSLNRRSLTRVERRSMDVGRRENRDARTIRQSYRTPITRDSAVNKISRVNLSERRTRSSEREENNNIVRRENRELSADRRASRVDLNERRLRSSERVENNNIVHRENRIVFADRRTSRVDLNKRRQRSLERRENNNIARHANRETEANRRSIERFLSRDSSMRRSSRINLNERRSRSAERQEIRKALGSRRSWTRTTSRNPSENRISRSDLDNRMSRSVDQRANDNAVQREKREARTDRRSLERVASRDSLMRRNSRMSLDDRRSRTTERRENREARTDRRSLERLASRDSSNRRLSTFDLNERRSGSAERQVTREARADRRSMERLVSRNSSNRRLSAFDLNERRSRSAERQVTREARTDRRSIERFASRNSSVRRDSRSDLDERRSRSAERSENREIPRKSRSDLDERRSRSAERREHREVLENRRSFDQFASRDSLTRRNSRSDLVERRSRSRVLALRSVDRRNRMYQEKRSTRNSLPSSVEKSERSDRSSRFVERRELATLARQNSNKYDDRRSPNERNMGRARSPRVTENRALVRSAIPLKSEPTEPTTLIREERENRFARAAQALDSRRVLLLKSMELEKAQDNRRFAFRRVSEKRSTTRTITSARKVESSENTREKLSMKRVERRVDLPVLKNARDSHSEIAGSVHRKPIELFMIYREGQDVRKFVFGNTVNIPRKFANNDNSFKYEAIPFPTYEIMRQAAVMTLCAAYAMHIYNGKRSSIWNLFERMGRLMVW